MEKTRGSFSRRNVLIVAGGALAAVGALIAAPYRAVIGRRARELTIARAPRRSQSLATAGYDEWTQQIGSTLAIAGAQGLSLAGVRALESSGPRPLGARDRAFVAVFDVRGGGSMAGDLIYTVSHPQYGPFQLFLSVADARTPNRMLAVFN
jgi:hypothetical protein